MPRSVRSQNGLQTLERMQHPLTQQWESCPAISHAFEKLSCVDLSLDHSLAVRQSQPCGNSQFLSPGARGESSVMQGSDSQLPWQAKCRAVPRCEYVPSVQ